MNSFEAVRFRWSHSLHHNYTASIDPHDFEVDGSIFWKPKKLVNFLLIFLPGFGLLNLNKSIQKEILEHALGIQTKVMKECIPEHKKASCILISRIYVSIWIMIIGLSIFSLLNSGFKSEDAFLTNEDIFEIIKFTSLEFILIEFFLTIPPTLILLFVSSVNDLISEGD